MFTTLWKRYASIDSMNKIIRKGRKREKKGEKGRKREKKGEKGRKCATHRLNYLTNRGF